MGAGLVVINDNFGINTNLESILSYSYKIDWINYSVSFGLQGSFAHQRIDFSKLNQEVPDPSIPISAENVGTTNFGTGIFLAHEKYYIGLSVPRMLRTNLSPDNAREVLYNRHYYLSVGYIFDYVSFIKIKPSLLVKAVEGESVSIDLNGQVIISDQVWLGVAFNNLNAAGFNFQYVEGSVRFGYAFEIPVNSLASISFGTHELMIAVDANLLKKHKLKDRYY